MPARSIALRRRMPVVVSSQPPITFGISSGNSLCISVTRSPPSSMMMFGPTSSTRRRSSSYSSIVAPWTANTFSPAWTRAAATSSCVESGLQPVAYMSAPPAARHRHRRAVFASIWTLRATFMPAKGFVSMKSFSMPASRGMWSRTHWIFSAPLSHRLMSRM